jgi:hypothetical protein
MHPARPSDWHTSGHGVGFEESTHSLHTGAHALSTQPPVLGAALQVFPHSPQLLASLVRSTHSPSHRVSGSVHGLLCVSEPDSVSVPVDSSSEVSSSLVDESVPASIPVSESPAGTQIASTQVRPTKHCPPLQAHSSSPEMHWLSSPTPPRPPHCESAAIPSTNAIP